MRPVKLRFTAEAREHIAAIYSYIQDRNPVAATQVVARIRLAAEQLADLESAQPLDGRANINHASFRIEHIDKLV